MISIAQIQNPHNEIR